MDMWLDRFYLKPQFDFFIKKLDCEAKFKLSCDILLVNK